MHGQRVSRRPAVLHDITAVAQQEPDIVVEGAGDEEQSDEHGQEEQRLALTLQDLGRVHFR